MVRSRDVVQAEGSARTEGARRATGVPADGAAAGAGSLAPGQRWSASRKRDVVLRLLCGESLEALSREVGVEIYRLDAWRARAMAGLEFGLKARHGEPWRRCSTRRSGTSGSCRWRSSCSASGPGPRSSASLWRCGGRDDERDDLRGDGALFRHSAGVSGLGALALGALRAAGAGTPPPAGPGPARRGPPPRQSDAQLLAAIRTDLARSPFHGEGHRKVHARLRILDGIRVARTRVLRVMGRTDCSPRTAGVRAPRRPTTGGSSLRRPT